MLGVKKKLGFGLMRLPKNGDVIDVEQTKVMVDKFLEAGFTYFDTAWAYQGSEDAIRQALVERYPRESYTLATKLAAWLGEQTKEAAEAQFETSLQRTGAGYFDFYLLHNLGKDHTHFFDDFGLWDFVKQKKEEGKIRHYGFSFHSTPDELEAILKAHPDAEFVQLQVNYADWEDKDVQAKANIEVCRKYGKPVVVMEPVKGGLLATPPEAITKILKEAEPESSPASWAIRFAADIDQVMVVLSGMSNVEQMEDNIATMKDFQGLTDGQKAVIQAARDELAKIPLIQCTACNYCAEVCPNNIGISDTFKICNSYALYQNLEHSKGRFGMLTRSGKALPSECVQCGACEGVCPQHLPIRDLLQKAAETFL